MKGYNSRYTRALMHLKKLKCAIYSNVPHLLSTNRVDQTEAFIKVSPNKGLKLTILAALVISFTAAANTFSSEDTDSRARNLVLNTSDIVDTVDPQSGSLFVKHKDLELPGNGGLDITIYRNYSLSQLSAGLTSSYVRSFKWVALGPGWSMLVAPRLSHDNDFTIAPAGLFYPQSPLTKLCAGQTLSPVSDGSVFMGSALPYLELPSGERFPLYSTGGYVAKSKNNWKVQCTSGNLTAYSPEGVVYDFGQLESAKKIGTYFTSVNPPMSMKMPPARSVTYLDATRATDPNGNWLAFQYKAFGTLSPAWPLGMNYSYGVAWQPAEYNYERGMVPTTITSSDGRTITFSYDTTTGRLLTLSDNSGRSIQYQHSTLNSETRVLTKVTLTDDVVWVYGYHPGNYTGRAYSASKMTQLTDAWVSELRLSTLKYPDGGTVNYEYSFYDYQGPMTSTGTLVSRAEVVKKRSLSTGESWQYTYTKGGSGQYDVTTEDGPQGRTTYKYMGAGYSSPASGLSNTVWQIGQLIEKQLPDGSLEKYEWSPREIFPIKDSYIELKVLTDEKTWVADLAKRTYVRNGASYIATMSGHDAYGNPTTKTESGPNGGSKTTTYTYLNDTTKWIIGRLKNETTANTSIVRSFDAKGNLLSLNQDGVTTSFTYDTQGNIASKTMPRGLVHTYSSYKRGIAQAENQPEGVNLSRDVDNAGNVISETNGEGYTTYYTYDSLNRQTSITKPLGNVKYISYTANEKTATSGSLVEKTVYDVFGQVASVTLGNITITAKHDYLGRKTFESNPNSSQGTSYLYDVLDRVTKITNADGTYRTHSYGDGSETITDERGNSTTYFYRSYSEPKEKHLMRVVAQDLAGSITITRNSRDLVTSVLQSGVTRSYGYNSNYYLTSVTNPETGTTTYGRDLAGNMTSRSTGSSGTTYYVYDDQNRIESVTYPNDAPSILNTYNKTGRMLSANSSSGNREFTYDVNGNLLTESLKVGGYVFTASHTYNGNDQLVSTTYPRSGRTVNYAPDVLGRPTQVSGYVNSVLYWPSGQLRQINYANATSTTYGQNARLWPSSFMTAKAGGATYASSTYGYDGLGNLTAITSSVDTSDNRAMGYDTVNRLTSISGPWGSGSISYNGVGNITGQTLGSFSLSYSYDGSNRLASISGTRNSYYSYDAYGNITSDQANSFVYDGVPNLRCANCNGVNEVRYAYDGTNQRSSVTKSGGITYEMYDAKGRLLIEFTPSTNKLTEYLYLDNKRVAQRVSP